MGLPVRVWVVLGALCAWSEIAAQPSAVFDLGSVNNSAAIPSYASSYSITVVVGNGLTLTAIPYLVPLEANESISSVHFTADTMTIGEVADVALLHDLTTGDDVKLDLSLQATPDSLRPGFAPLWRAGEVDIRGTRYADLLLFPVSVSPNGSYVFARSVTIDVGGRGIAAQTLLSRNEMMAAEYSSQTSPSQVVDFGQIDYVIVTSAALQNAFAPLALYRSQTGLRSEIKTIESIVASYQGRDDAERLRAYLKDFYAQGGRYILLGGDQTVVPVRYAYNFNSDTLIPIDQQQVCDFYFADLTGNWDVDCDNIWGESTDDAADLKPELWVGRLPFSQSWEVSNYVSKLIAYETDPGFGDPSYLGRSFFFSSDQMRDYGVGGQHNRVAMAFPSQLSIDTVKGVEQSSGADLDPTNGTADQMIGQLSQGYGIVNVLAHGASSLFGVRSSGYNEWPKSSIRVSSDTARTDNIVNLPANGRTSLYYSIACGNGEIDHAQAPFNDSTPNVLQALLSLKDAGAIAGIGNSRWGWVSVSYLLQKAFYDSSFAHPDRPAVQAMYGSKAAYYYYRDLVYGQNFLGDPALRIYSGVPGNLLVTTTLKGDTLTMTASSSGKSIGGVSANVSCDGQLLGRVSTGADGVARFVYPFGLGTTYTVSFVKSGYAINQTTFVPSIATDVDDRPSNIPATYSLAQNFPNPFNPTTTISFDLPRQSQVELRIYNLLGQQVTTLANGAFLSGHHELIWNGCDGRGQSVAGGIYFYKIEAGDFSESRKMALVK